jgi:hypothetical protein
MLHGEGDSSAGLEESPTVTRRILALDALRAVLGRSIAVHTQCEGVHIRRIIVTEPDATGCNWQIEWPMFRPANIEPCRRQLRELIERLRMRFNVER